MPRFFVDSADGDLIAISGEDARHIGKSLRMRVGEELCVCDGCGVDCQCVIDTINEEEVLLKVISRTKSDSEPDISVTLYQGYPKGDKLENVIEKAVELGVSVVVPVMTERSVARPDAKSLEKKHQRWQRHALEAAKQCGRSVIPQVMPLVQISDISERLKTHELCIFCYELGGEPLGDILSDTKARDIGLFIGPEGGISFDEAEMLKASGAVAATLGKRILRTETAPIAALSTIMFATGNLQ